MLHNTVSPTIVRGGDTINVIPSEITLELDGRLLPGFTPSHPTCAAMAGRPGGAPITMTIYGRSGC